MLTSCPLMTASMSARVKYLLDLILKLFNFFCFIHSYKVGRDTWKILQTSLLLIKPFRVSGGLFAAMFAGLIFQQLLHLWQSLSASRTQWKLWEITWEFLAYFFIFFHHHCRNFYKVKGIFFQKNQVFKY